MHFCGYSWIRLRNHLLLWGFIWLFVLQQNIIVTVIAENGISWLFLRNHMTISVLFQCKVSWGLLGRHLNLDCRALRYSHKWIGHSAGWWCWTIGLVKRIWKIRKKKYQIHRVSVKILLLVLKWGFFCCFGWQFITF